MSGNPAQRGSNLESARNFQCILWATRKLLESSCGRDKGMSDLQTLKKAADVFRSSDMTRDYRPVNTAEAELITDAYYREKYGAFQDAHKRRDIALRRARVLTPGSVDSFLFRPVRNLSGALERSGPETHDFEGVDDGSNA